MTLYKLINLPLVLITFSLAVATTVSSSKNAQLVQFVKDTGLKTNADGEALLNLYKSSIAMSIFSFLLLLMAFGVAFANINTKLFVFVKAVLCVAVLVLGILLIVFGIQLRNLPDNQGYGRIGIATGAVSILAVGSCVLTVFKMLFK